MTLDQPGTSEAAVSLQNCWTSQSVWLCALFKLDLVEEVVCVCNRASGELSELRWHYALLSSVSDLKKVTTWRCCQCCLVMYALGQNTPSRVYRQFSCIAMR